MKIPLTSELLSYIHWTRRSPLSANIMGTQKISYVDLLIIGAGPAGLVAAYWASEYGLDARVIDDKPDRVTKGHADGITCRTMEIFDSFGIVGQVYEEAALDYQIRYWASCNYVPTPSDLH